MTGSIYAMESGKDVKQLTAEEKELLVIYYRNHNAEDTMETFGVSRATINRCKKKYDGTIESLMDGRKKSTRVGAFTHEEKMKYIEYLRENYHLGDKRVRLAQFYSEICKANDGQGRSYHAVGNKLRQLKKEEFPEADQKISTKAYVKTDRKRYHAAKVPGTLQIDMMYVPKSCYWESMRFPENIARLRKKIIEEARCGTDLVIQEYQIEAMNHPDRACFLMGLRRDAEKDFHEIYEDVMHCTAEDLLPQRMYQYTAVDECTGWPHR